MPESQTKPMTGGCLCGAVRYHVDAAPMLVTHCFCEPCRRTSATSHATHVVVPEERTTITGPLTRYERPADSGSTVVHAFCPTCGSPIHSSSPKGTGRLFLRASTLDDPSRVTPQLAVYVKRAPDWAILAEESPQFEEMPSPVDLGRLLKARPLPQG